MNWVIDHWATLFDGIGVWVLGLVLAGAGLLWRWNKKRRRQRALWKTKTQQIKKWFQTAEPGKYIAHLADPPKQAEPSVQLIAKPDQAEPVRPVPTARYSRISLLKPQEILDTLEKLPPYQREAAAANYVGTVVQWTLLLNGADRSRREQGRISLHLLVGHWKMIYVRCHIDESEYPEVKFMNKHAPMRVTGVIKSIDDPTINLRDVELDFQSVAVTNE